MRIFLISLLAGCSSSAPVLQSISRNSTWADDEAAVLLIENHYETPDPSAPYFADPDATGWEIVFVQADETLNQREELLRVPDPSPQGGGGLFSAAYWLRGAEVAVTLLHDELMIVDLTGGSVCSLSLPDGLSEDWFGPDVTESRGLVASYAPSPDGERVAVMFTLAYLNENDPGIAMTRYLHGLGFFSIQGEYLGGASLTPWNTTHESLKIDPPAVRLPFEIPPPPTISPWQSLQRPVQFLWKDDSSGVFIVDRALEHGENNEAVLVGVTDPTSFASVDVIPELPLVTTGGPIRSDGLLLIAKETVDEPNSAHIELVQTSGWVGFQGRGVISVEDLSYGY